MVDHVDSIINQAEIYLYILPVMNSNFNINSIKQNVYVSIQFIAIVRTYTSSETKHANGRKWIPLLFSQFISSFARCVTKATGRRSTVESISHSSHNLFTPIFRYDDDDDDDDDDDPRALFVDHSRGHSPRRQCLHDSDNVKRRSLRCTKINPSMGR